MFMVGVAMPLAFAKRAARGESWAAQFGHVIVRCLLLIFIGVVLDSFGKNQVTIQFIRVLQQIAIGYFLAFLVLHCGWRVQAAAAGLLLIAHTAAFAIYPGQFGDPRQGGTNIGMHIDVTINGFFASLGMPNVWPPSTGGYVVLNAISSTSTILFGVLAGRLIQSSLSRPRQLLILTVAGIAGLVLGLLLELWVPLVKRIWTATFAIYAAGWTCLMMAFFYWAIDIRGWRRWSFPLMVVGVNSIFIYVSAGLLSGTIRNVLKPFTTAPLTLLGPWGPVVTAALVVLVQWSLCYWLYRQRVFFKV